MADQQRYTLEQAAAQIGMRADDMASILPDAGIDIASLGHEGGTLSAEEVARLTRLVARIKQFHNGLSDIDN